MTKTELYVRSDEGEGRLVVLLHGLFGDGTQWEKISEILVKSGHRVVALDLLGHGKSPRPIGSNFNAKENVLALRASLVRINATKDTVVLGYSMGGAVAISYCAKYPKSVKELIIISTPFYLKPEQMVHSKYALSVFLTKFSSRFYSIATKLFLPDRILYKAASIADSSEAFHKSIGAYGGKQDPRAIRNSISNLVQYYDFAGELAKVRAPVSFYCGKKDVFIVQSQLYALKQFKPYIHIQRLDIIKIDHMLVQNLPHEIVQLITMNEEKVLHISTDTKTGNPLIMLHGIESASSYWAGVIKPLSENNRVICIDLLGYGKSPKPSNIAYSIDEHVEYLHRTIVSLRLKKYRIAAHSLGTIVSYAYAAKYPTEVTGMYLFAPVLMQKEIQPKRFIIKNMNMLSVFSDNGLLHPEIAKAIGDQRIAKISPTFRTIQNTIYAQKPIKWGKIISKIPITFVYGKLDTLVDGDSVRRVASIGKSNTVTVLDGAGHNFILYNPDIVLNTIEPSTTHKSKAKKATIIPINYFKHIASLAVPSLSLKSFLYTGSGLLLFSSYAEVAITAGFAAMIANKSYKIIRGAFSLKNEGLAYIGYILLSAFMALAVFGVVLYPELSLKIVAYSVAAIVFISGILRLVTAIAWTKQGSFKRSLIISGSLMAVVGLGALLGGIFSAYVIAYGIAIYMIVRGLLYGFYAASIGFFAFMRGYTKT